MSLVNVAYVPFLTWAEDIRKFRAPSSRNIAVNEPYMHPLATNLKSLEIVGVRPFRASPLWT
jgi:hypothetical protein